MLVLEDGRTFRGRAYGAVGETFGEAVFSTGMTGYQETLTDPSYHRQVVVMTAPHIGNTGVNDEDPESARSGSPAMWCATRPVRPPTGAPRRSLDDELTAQGVVGISGIDTRALTRHLRERGAMRVGIFSGEAAGADEAALLARVRPAPADEGRRPEPARSPPRSRTSSRRIGHQAVHRRRRRPRHQGHDPAPDGRARHRGARPARHRHRRRTSTRSNPDGVFFSNGPGDPATADHPVALMRGVLERGTPLFGICFGNQILGRALGFGTYKLKYGHRGINQPVQDRTTGKVEVTAHNHGFAVDAPLDAVSDTPYGRAEVSHVCLNDDVVEGLRLLDRPAFSVQYHPEAAAGPHDAAYLFDRFVALMAQQHDSTLHMEGQRA